MVSLTSQGTQITALALSPARTLLAFSQRGERPVLTVWDLQTGRRLRILRCAEFLSQEVVSLAFSHDSKYLLAQVALIKI